MFTTVASTANIAPTASIVSALGTLIGILLIVIIALSIAMVLVVKSKKTAHDQQTMYVFYSKVLE